MAVRYRTGTQGITVSVSVDDTSDPDNVVEKDFTGTSQHMLHFRKPDGSISTVSANVNDNRIEHVINDDLLDQRGMWSYWATWMDGTYTDKTNDSVTFWVV